METPAYEGKQHSLKNKKTLWIIAAAIVFIVIGIFLFGGTEGNNGSQDSRIVTGYFACLPPKDGGAEGDTCALGIRGDDDNYYAIDISEIEIKTLDLSAEDRLEAEGRFDHGDTTPDDRWEDYNIEGILFIRNLYRY